MFLESFMPLFAGTLGIGAGIVITLIAFAIVSAIYNKVS